MSYDDTGGLGASTYRHVAFVEQTVPRRASATVELGMPAAALYCPRATPRRSAG
jgi:formate dehydrogenase iron-sulfur subunit